MRGKKGASGLTYGILVGLVAVVAIAAINSTGGSVNRLFGTVSARLLDVRPLPPPAAPSATTPKDCQAVRDSGQTTDGTYTIDPDGAGSLAVFSAYCDMRGSEGWTLIARNVAAESTAQTFNQTYATFATGFGGPAVGQANSNGWIGNDRISSLTQPSGRLEARDGVGNIWTYSSFQVGNAATQYTLTVSGGSDGGSFANHSGMKFTATDQDNDTWPGNCANNGYGTGWWYYGCYAATIMGNSSDRLAQWAGGRAELTLWVRP